MTLKLIWILSVLPTLAFGRITLSRQYPFSPAMLKKVESKLQDAFERDAEMQQYMAYYSIDEALSISLSCGPHLPDKDGKGCRLLFAAQLENAFSISLSKNLLMKGVPKLVETRLAEVNPNNTDEHQHFGSIFEPQDTYSSHYFCEPTGAAGKKTWACFLHVSESMN